MRLAYSDRRGSVLPRYESWVPRYVDYLFIAFTTSFAFSPTDTLPLTRTAKILMMAQAAISVVTLTGSVLTALKESCKRSVHIDARVITLCYY